LFVPKGFGTNKKHLFTASRAKPISPSGQSVFAHRPALWRDGQKIKTLCDLSASALWNACPVEFRSADPLQPALVRRASNMLLSP
jgi:hypothetical protein